MAPGVAVVIPARDEAARIGATVAAALRVPGVDLAVVVDDGSRDATADLARAAGAHVVSHRRSRGKGAALETGADAVRVLDARDAVPEARALLLLDADLEDSAAKVAPLLEPVLSSAADLAVALLPPQATPGGGRGRVVRLARSGIATSTGFVATQPLSGQRALTRAAFDAARPLAPGFGVEVGMTVDLLRRGFRVVEVPVDLHHRVTGADLSGRLHRGRQLVHVARALAVRGIVGDREVRWLEVLTGRRSGSGAWPADGAGQGDR